MMRRDRADRERVHDWGSPLIVSWYIYDIAFIVKALHEEEGIMSPSCWLVEWIEVGKI